MLNIKLIVVGKFKEKYWSEAEAEYRKRLTPYAKISLVELNEIPFKSEVDRERIRAEEAIKIKNVIPENAFIIALTETGTEFTSPEFATWLTKRSEQGQVLVFIIGGPLGLDRELLQQAHATVSLSALTFPHQMARVIVMEQLYRAAMIATGKQYHY